MSLSVGDMNLKLCVCVCVCVCMKIDPEEQDLAENK